MAFCPDMKPVMVFGNTEKEASAKLNVAVEMYVNRHPKFVDTTRHASLA